jgi:biopolymer transport protein TolQ
MNNAHEMTIIQSFIESGPFIWIVVGSLVLGSLWSWTLIFGKWMNYRKTHQLDKKFLKEFNQAEDLAGFADKLKYENRAHLGLASVFMVGVEEFKRLKNMSAQDSAESMRRAMAAKSMRMIDDMENGLSTLASIASIAPYVGLLGTVWGIIHAFSGLAQLEQATLAAVAPGISEALVATAIGLFVAIPASWAYNQFVRSMERFTVRTEGLIEEISRLCR